MKNILVLLGLTAVSSLCIAAPQSTSPFKYTYVEGELVDMGGVGYADGNRRGDGDVNGLRVKGSFDVAPAFSVVGSLMETSGDNFDIGIITAGAAYHQALPAIHNMPFDLVVKAEIEHVSFDFENKYIRDESETGLLVTGGVQLAVIDKLQAFHEISVSNNDYRDFSFKVGARYEFIPQLSGTAAVEVGDIDVISAGLRYSF